HIVHVPEKFLQVLHPFEIGDSDAAGVGQDVGNHDDAFFEQYAVGAGSGRAVGGLGDDPGFDAVGVGHSDLVFQRGGNQHVTIQLQYFLAGDGFGSGKAGHGPGFGLVGHDVRNVQAFAVEDSTLGIANGNDLGPKSMQQLGGDATGVAKALNGGGGAGVVDVLYVEGAADHIHAASGRGFVAAERAAQKDRLPGDHAGSAVAKRHAVGVHDPG